MNWKYDKDFKYINNKVLFWKYFVCSIFFIFENSLLISSRSFTQNMTKSDHAHLMQPLVKSQYFSDKKYQNQFLNRKQIESGDGRTKSITWERNNSVVEFIAVKVCELQIC
jgi:hypothetical protein